MSRRPVLLLVLLVGLHGALHDQVCYHALADAAHAARSTWGKVKAEENKSQAALPVLLAVSVAGQPPVAVQGALPFPPPAALRRSSPEALPHAGPRAPPAAA
jgi:hypothetical protein